MSEYCQPLKLFRPSASQKWGLHGAGRESKGHATRAGAQATGRNTVDEKSMVGEGDAQHSTVTSTDTDDQLMYGVVAAAGDKCKIGRDSGRKARLYRDGWGPQLDQPSRYLQQPAPPPRPRKQILEYSSRFDSSGAFHIVHTMYASGPASGGGVMSLSGSAALLPQCMTGSTVSRSISPPLGETGNEPRLTASRSAQSIRISETLPKTSGSDTGSNALVAELFKSSSNNLDHGMSLTGRRNRPRLHVSGRPGGSYRQPGTPYLQPGHFSTLCASKSTP